jgi:hypothetical protein
MLWRALAIVTIAAILGFGLYSVMQYTGVAAPAAANAGGPAAWAGGSVPAGGPSATGTQPGGAQGLSGAAGSGGSGGPGGRAGHAPLSLGAKLAAVGLAFAKFAGGFAAAAAALALAKRFKARANKAPTLAAASGSGNGAKK